MSTPLSDTEKEGVHLQTFEPLGRPKLYTDLAKFTVRMEKRLAKALEERARGEGVSRNVLIQREMATYLLSKGGAR